MSLSALTYTHSHITTIQFNTPHQTTHRYTAYARIVSAVKGKTTSNLGEDPGQASSSMLGGIKERLFSSAGGETMDERRLRLRLDWYRRVLQVSLSLEEL